MFNKVRTLACRTGAVVAGASILAYEAAKPVVINGLATCENRWDNVVAQRRIAQARTSKKEAPLING